MNRVYESMTRLIRADEGWGTVTIRVWREAECFTTGPDPEVEGHFASILWPLPILTFDDYARAIVQHLTALPGIAAVEVLDEAGNGGLLYPDWS